MRYITLLLALLVSLVATDAHAQLAGSWPVNLDQGGMAAYDYNVTDGTDDIDLTAKSRVAIVVKNGPDITATTVRTYDCDDSEMTCTDGNFTLTTPVDSLTTSSDGLTTCSYCWHELQVTESGEGSYRPWLKGPLQIHPFGVAGSAVQTGTLTVTGGAATLTTGAAVQASSVADNGVTPDAVLSTGQTDEYCLTYEATGDTWEWQTCGSGSGDNFSANGTTLTDVNLTDSSEIAIAINRTASPDEVSLYIVTGSIANTKLANSTVSYGGVSLSLGGSDATPAFDLQDATGYPALQLTGTLANLNTALGSNIADGAHFTPSTLASDYSITGTADATTFVRGDGTYAVPAYTVDTDNQTIDVLSFDGTSISISLEDDGQATQTLDISSVSTDDQTASEVTSTVTGNIEATNVDAAIAELEAEKQPLDADLTDLADGSLTGTKVGFADTNGDYAATDVQSAIEELASVNGSGVNSATAKVDWTQLGNVPAGFADGSDDGAGGAAGTLNTIKEDDSAVGGSDIVTLDFGTGFDLAESPDTEIQVSIDATELEAAFEAVLDLQDLQGAVTDGQLPAEVPLTDEANTFTAEQAFSDSLIADVGIRFSVTGSDPILSASNGVLNLSSGALQVGGVATCLSDGTDCPADDTGTDDQTAAEVSVAATPSNYTAGTADVEAHLAGIDTALGSATGDVSAASTFGTDNSIIRADGTAKGVQSSGSTATIDDSGNISATRFVGGAGTLANPAVSLGSVNTGFYSFGGAIVSVIAGQVMAYADATGTQLQSDGGFLWTSNATNASDATDTALSRTAAGTVSVGTSLGAADGTLSAASGLFSATLRLPSSTTLPATCSVGDSYWDTDADTDGSLYVCRATDTWKEVDDDGGAGGGAPTDATYWTTSADGTLSAEVVVNSLATLNSTISASIADGAHTTDTDFSDTVTHEQIPFDRSDGVAGTDSLKWTGGTLLVLGDITVGGASVQTGTDDDVPESGDFGNAADLEADGSLSADVVAPAEMADADHGDVAWTSGVATVENVQCSGSCISDSEVDDGITTIWRNAQIQEESESGTSPTIDSTRTTITLSGNTAATVNSALKAANEPGFRIDISNAGGHTFSLDGTDIPIRTGDTVVWCDYISAALNCHTDLQLKTYAITVEDPTNTEDISLAFTSEAITVKEMRAVLVGSATPSVTWTIRHGSDRSATGAEVVTSGTTTTSTTTGSDVTTLNDGTIAADSFLWLETTAQSGTVTELHITILYYVD